MWGKGGGRDRDGGGGKGGRDRDGGGGRGRGGGDRWGGDRWGGPRRSAEDRALDEERPQEHHHELAGFASKESGPLKFVQLDALVFLQIMKHCRQHSPYPVTGQLLGLDVEDTLEVSHSFGYVQRSGDDNQGGADDGAQYQIETLKRLREVNVDSNTVGWYQTTHLGQFFGSTVIETQYLYQTEIARSVLVVYDSLQSAIGKPAFKALQLTPHFMKAYAESSEANRAALAEFPSHDMFMEIPVTIGASALTEAFLVDWAIADPIATTSQVDILDVENQAFLEKNIQLLIGSLQELADEQQKLIQFERLASRKGDPPQKGRDRFRPPVQPRHLDTMVLSQQIQNYCKAINGYAGDSFGKLYLMSNKPSGAGSK